MGWSIGWDSDYQRFKGYGVPCLCEHPECSAKIDRGMSYLCKGCEMAFCGNHLVAQFCERCLDREGLESDAEDIDAHPDAKPFPLKPEHPEWLTHIRTDESWTEWREETANMQQLETWERTAQAAKQGAPNGQ